MKTKTLIMVCRLLGIGLTQLSAQNGKNGTGTEVLYVQNAYWFTPVYCDGVIVDDLEGMGDVHHKLHYINGYGVWGIGSYRHGVGTSLRTNETFTFSELDKQFFSMSKDTWVWTANTHVKGDKGSLYNLSLVFIWNGTEWIMNVKNATCTGNAK